MLMLSKSMIEEDQDFLMQNAPLDMEYNNISIEY